MINKKALEKIWYQVPPDYYEKGVKGNILQRYWHDKKVENLKKLMKRKKIKTILDVGCASGRMANEISKILLGTKITGLDVYKKSIEYGRKKYPHIKFVVGDAHNLPFPANSFDLVICYETIEHVVDPKKVIEEIKRVAKRNGHMIVAMDSGNLLFKVVWSVWEHTKGSVWRGSHLHPFHHWELEKLIRQAHLTIRKKHFSHFGMEVSFLLKL